MRGAIAPKRRSRCWSTTARRIRFRQPRFTRPVQMTDGGVSVPTGPGLGVEVDRAVLEAYRA